MYDVNRFVFLFVLIFSISVTAKDFQKDSHQLQWLNTTHKLTHQELNYIKNKKLIKVCTNPNWKPIEFTKDEKPQGISIDILNMLAKKLDIKVNYIKTDSWKQSQEYLKNKKCDILPAAIKTAKREKYATFTKPYLSYTLAIITKNDKPFVTELESVINKKMSRKKGSGLISKLKRLYPKVEIQETDDIKSAFHAVQNDEVYFTIATLPILSYYKNKYGLDNLQIAGYTKMKYNLSIAVRDDDEDLLHVLNKTLINIPNETLYMINDKWSAKKVIKKVDYEILWQVVAVFSVILVIVIFFLIRQSRLTTQLEKQKDELQKTNDNFNLGQEIAKVGVWNLDYNTNKLDWSQGVHQIFGTNEKTFNATFENFISYVHPQDRDRLVSVYKESIANQTSYFLEHRLLLEDGTLKYVEERGQNFFDKKGNIIRSMGTVLDVTERKSIELELEHLNKDLELKVKDEVEKNRQKDQQILHQSKLAQMGEMISMIAHQWRQPLAAISATINNLLFQIIMDEYKKDEFESELNLISSYSQHLSKTIDDFRDFFKSNKNKEVAYLQDIIDDTLRIVKPSIENKNIKLITNFNCNELLNTYPNEIKQVILNLIKNAEDILLEREIKEPKIKIDTKRVEVDSKKEGIVIQISDNAGGVPKDILHKVFEPYFSTKLEKEGTGLGLYMSKTIIEEHCNGKLLVFNDENGAVFRIDFNQEIIESN
jgi:PAS domain S-box-containing protein